MCMCVCVCVCVRVCVCLIVEHLFGEREDQVIGFPWKVDRHFSSCCGNNVEPRLREAFRGQLTSKLGG